MSSLWYQRDMLCSQDYDPHWRQTEFPDLSRERIIGLDIETYDPLLKEQGPAWGTRRDGYIVGVSISTQTKAWYYPIAHKIIAEWDPANLDYGAVKRYLTDTLSTAAVKIGANLQYDAGWLESCGIPVKGKLYDVQFAEALIDDVAQSYSLDTVATKYLGKHKESNELFAWARAAFRDRGYDQRKNIWRCPASLTATYAEGDAMLPIRILKKQLSVLERLGLEELFDLECRLIPCLIQMRLQGIRVDEDAAEQAIKGLNTKIAVLQDQLNTLAGGKMTSANSSAEIAEMFRLHKQAYPMTDSGNPSFVKDWLKNNPFEGAQLVYNIRRLAKVESTFLRGMLIDGASNGKLYPSLHPLRGESGGAVSGRFSCSKPNSQQIPSRDDELAPIIRGMFKPEEGKQWLKLDYSQIEYRFFAHYSNDEMLMEAYKDPDADFHDLVGKMLGGTLPRTPIKNFNFGLLYGMGKDKLKRMLSEHNLPMSSEAFFKLYHEKFPAAKRVSQECTDEATKTGEIRTILNRRNTFNLWEPVDYAAPALPFGHAVKAYGGKIRRAFTHKALNRRLQGSSADLLKKAMVTLHEDGTYARVGYPYITVHDELDHGYHADLHEDFQHIKEVMETAIPLRVPVRVDAELGPDWGHLEDFDL